MVCFLKCWCVFLNFSPVKLFRYRIVRPTDRNRVSSGGANIKNICVQATIHCYLDTPRPVSIRFSTELINVGPKFSNIAESLDPELLSTPKSEAIQILARKIQ